jgi:nucleotidyltransferase/DNA polymerase involved in DNA repair
VVATASYEARAFGVHSGMPVRAAYKKCPTAVFLPSDPAAYDAASAEVMDTLRSFPVVVEVWGWDECFVGAETEDPEALAAALRAAVAERTGLTCSIGIGDNKTRAKLATGFAKHQRSHAHPFDPPPTPTTPGTTDTSDADGTSSDAGTSDAADASGDDSTSGDAPSGPQGGAPGGDTTPDDPGTPVDAGASGGSSTSGGPQRGAPGGHSTSDGDTTPDDAGTSHDAGAPGGSSTSRSPQRGAPGGHGTSSGDTTPDDPGTPVDAGASGGSSTSGGPQGGALGDPQGGDGTSGSAGTSGDAGAMGGANTSADTSADTSTGTSGGTLSGAPGGDGTWGDDATSGDADTPDGDGASGDDSTSRGPQGYDSTSRGPQRGAPGGHDASGGDTTPDDAGTPGDAGAMGGANISGGTSSGAPDGDGTPGDAGAMGGAGTSGGAAGGAAGAGVYRLTGANWRAVMDHRPVRDLWGIGSRMERNLNELGLTTVADLAAADLEVLKKRFGPKMGAWYAALGRGLGDTQVTDVPREPVSRSHEETFPDDLADRADVERELRRIALEVTREVVAEGRTVQRVAVKVRFRNFYTPIKSRKLPQPTQDPDVVATTALALLEKFTLNRPIRLLGVRVEFVRN